MVVVEPLLPLSAARGRPRAGGDRRFGSDKCGTGIASRDLTERCGPRKTINYRFWRRPATARSSHPATAGAAPCQRDLAPPICATGLLRGGTNRSSESVGHFALVCRDVLAWNGNPCRSRSLGATLRAGCSTGSSSPDWLSRKHLGWCRRRHSVPVWAQSAFRCRWYRQPAATPEKDETMTWPTDGSGGST
jgi:hypothetical protein